MTKKPPAKKDTRNRFAPFVNRIVEAYKTHCLDIQYPKSEYGYIVAAIKRVAKTCEVEENEDRNERAAVEICEAITIYVTPWHREKPTQRMKGIGLLMSPGMLDNRLIPAARESLKNKPGPRTKWQELADRLRQRTVVQCCFDHLEKGGTVDGFRKNFRRGGIPELLQRHEAIKKRQGAQVEHLYEIEIRVATIWNNGVHGTDEHFGMLCLAAGLGAIAGGFGKEANQ